MVKEDILRPPQQEINPENTPYPAKIITLSNGDKLVVRQIKRDSPAMPVLLKTVYETLKIDQNFYDLVGARLYGELLSYIKYRVRDEYVLIGQLASTGEIVGQVNGCAYNNPKIGISLHTMAFKRGLRVGAHLFAAKMEYHQEYLGHEEVKIVAESHIGFRRWMEELRLEEDFGFAHPLGLVPSYVLTKKNYEEWVEPEKVFGTRPVPEDTMEFVKTNVKMLDNVYKEITGKEEKIEPSYY